MQVTRDRRLRERAVGDWRHGFTVTSGRPPDTTGPQVVGGWVVDGAEHQLTAVRETHGATPQGDAGRVVVRAVDWIDEPGPAAWSRAPLLGDDAVLRAGGPQPINDQRLSGVIGGSHEVRD